jgi:predicted metalloprotease with PDZ domain
MSWKGWDSKVSYYLTGYGVALLLKSFCEARSGDVYLIAGAVYQQAGG